MDAIILDAVTASQAKDEALFDAHYRKLQGLVNNLLERHGSIPALLADLGDLEHDAGKAVRFLEAAFDAAAADEGQLKADIADSLIRRYTEELSDPHSAQCWLQKLRDLSNSSNDSTITETYERVTRYKEEHPS